MSFTFPTLNGCTPVKYPLSRAVTYQTSVARFLNDSEQRFAKRYSQNAFALYLANLDHNDRNTLEDFWEDCRGPLATWSIDIPDVDETGELRRVTYDGCSFNGDNITFSETDFPERWTCSIPARQVMYLNSDPFVASPGDFPQFKRDSSWSQAMFQRPIHTTNSMRSAQVDHPESGLRWVTALRNTPTGPRSLAGLHTWQFTVNANTRDILTLEAHFIACRGRLRRFGFHAPDRQYYPDCRYGSDTLEVAYAGPNDTSVEVTIEQIQPPRTGGGGGAFA